MAGMLSVLLIVLLLVVVAALAGYLLWRRTSAQPAPTALAPAVRAPEPALAPARAATPLPDGSAPVAAPAAPEPPANAVPSGPLRLPPPPASRFGAAPAPKGPEAAAPPKAPAPKPAVPAAKPALPRAASVPRAEAGSRVPSVEEDDYGEAEITQVGSVPAELLAQMRGKLSGDPPAGGIGEDDFDVGLEELVDENMAEEVTGNQVLILVSGHARSDRGLKRPCNEDAFLIVPEEPVFVVCDGMGGHAAGDVAANKAVSVIENAFKTRRFEGAGNHGWPRRGEELVAAIEMANAEVHAMARTDAKYRGMGTTVVAVRFAPNKQRAYIAHVGDSRCYRVRAGIITQLTEDHSIGNLMGVQGKAARHLARALGVRDTVAVDLTIDRPHPGDFYLVCSDGLNKMMPDSDIMQWVVQAEGSMDDKARSLINEANRRGGRDNITVIAIRVENPGPMLEQGSAGG
jgi:protein phosphatase